MKILLSGAGLFSLSLCLHLVIWQIRLPKGQIKALLQLFFTVLVIGHIYLYLTSSASFIECLHSCLLFVSLSLAYLCTYSAIAADSPSLVMMTRIAETGSAGLDREKLFASLDDHSLIIPRIKDLHDAQMLSLSQGKYRLTTRGRLFVRIFINYRKALRLPKGG